MKVHEIIKQQIIQNNYPKEDIDALVKKNFNRANQSLPCVSRGCRFAGHFDKYLYMYTFSEEDIKNAGLARAFWASAGRWDYGTIWGRVYLFHYKRVGQAEAFEILKKKLKLKPIEEIKLRAL